MNNTIYLKNKIICDIVKHHIDFLEDFPELYAIIIYYQKTIHHCNTLKQVRCLLEDGINELNIYSNKNDFNIQSIVSDIMPIFKLALDEIILNDLKLVYTDEEIEVMNIAREHFNTTKTHILVDNIFNLMLT